MRFAFYGRVSTEDAQDPAASRAWQLRRARDLTAQHGEVVEEFFDVGQSRSLPWSRRPEAVRLLEAIASPERTFDAIVIGEPQRAFYGNQFSLTFPVLTHYGVGLWVPEVGGAVDPASEAHDIVMSLFGGMSKAERSRIRTRTKIAMQELALTTDRHMGGRAPFGYRLADAGQHPNPAKAAAGQRSRVLEPDPDAAEWVRRIFELAADGQGFRQIARALDKAKVPTPSRSGKPWEYHTVRNIVRNPVYRGVRVWGKQEKVERLVDVGDVAAGTAMTMRHKPREEWLGGERRTHESLISDDLWEAAQEKKRPRERERTIHTYLLRGKVFCSGCGRRMQGRAHSKTGTIFYTCLHTRVEPERHEVSRYVREEALLEVVDDWLVTLFADTGWLTEAQEEEPPTSLEAARLRKLRMAARSKLDNLVAAVEAGLVTPTLVEQMREREREVEELDAQLQREIAPTRTARMSHAEIQQVVKDLGGIARIFAAATTEERAEVYSALDVRMTYDAGADILRLDADPCRINSGVRRGSLRPMRQSAERRLA